MNKCLKQSIELKSLMTFTVWKGSHSEGAYNKIRAVYFSEWKKWQHFEWRRQHEATLIYPGTKTEDETRRHTQWQKCRAEITRGRRGKIIIHKKGKMLYCIQYKDTSQDKDIRWESRPMLQRLRWKCWHSFQIVAFKLYQRVVDMTSLTDLTSKPVAEESFLQRTQASLNPWKLQQWNSGGKQNNAHEHSSIVLWSANDVHHRQICVREKYHIKSSSADEISEIRHSRCLRQPVETKTTTSIDINWKLLRIITAVSRFLL